MKKAIELKKFKYRMTKYMTKEEMFVDKKLNSLNIEYKKQMILGFYIIDFVLPFKMVCIEVDGLYHNKQKFKDALREKFIHKCGFNIVRIKNEDIELFDFNTLLIMPDYDLKTFRSALGKANSIKSTVIQKKYEQKL